jgi:Fe-S oxidoreductase
MYFAGCTASFVETDVAEASVRLLTDAGYDISYMGTDEACCGIPMKVAGKWDVFEEIYEHNVAEAEAGSQDDRHLVSRMRAGVERALRRLAAERGEEYEFEVKHYSELVSEALAEGALELKNPIEGRVTFHDSCHAGRAQGLYEPPREMLKAIPGVDYVEMEHNREEGCAAARCSRWWARCPWPRSSANTVCKKPWTSVRTRSWRSARAVRCSCATATSRTTSG